MLKIPPDYTTLLVQVAVIVTLWIVLSRLWFLPALKVIRERHAHSEGALERAKAIQAEAQALRTQHANAIDEARAEAQREMEEILRAAETEQRRLVGEAREESQRVLGEARSRIEEEVAAARRSLRDQADQIAKEVARKVLGRAV